MERARRKSGKKLPSLGKNGWVLPDFAKTAAGGARRFFRREDGGQAMAEACIVIPVLLMLFLGLWQHSLAEMAQTRVELAARHVAWARGALGKEESEAKAYAAPFFPEGTDLDIVQEDKTSYTKYRNELTRICASCFPVKGGKPGQCTASVTATMRALPVAAPKSPGERGEKGGAWDYLASVKTHEATVVWNNSEEQAEDYMLPLLSFTVARPELLIELGVHIAVGEIFNLLMKALAGTIADSGTFASIMTKLHLNFQGAFFKEIAEMLLGLGTDLYEILVTYFVH